MQPSSRSSTSAAPRAAFDRAPIQSILQASRRSNAGLDVTGCLLFSGRCFAQVLEGGAGGRDERWRSRIAADPRHTDVRVLSEDAAARSASTPTGAMGYLHDVNLEDDLETLLMIPERSPVVVADVMERMRPDPVMGALR